MYDASGSNRNDALILMSTATPVTKFAARPNQTALPYFQTFAGLTSTVGSKFLVALTGLGLTIFVYMHMAGNLLYSAGRKRQ